MHNKEKDDITIEDNNIFLEGYIGPIVMPYETKNHDFLFVVKLQCN